MGIITKAEYKTTPPTLSIDGVYQNLLVDAHGNLKTTGTGTANFRETNQYVAGSGSTTGKIGTVAAGATLIVAMDCNDFPVYKVDWAVDCDKSWSYQLGRCNNNPFAITLTLTDATAVDADDTFYLNGLLFTYKAGAGTPASRYIGLGADNAAAATNTATMLMNATYGVPGLLSATSTPVAATDVITILGDSNTTLQFAQGSSAPNEVAFASTTQTNIDFQGGQVTGNTTTAAWGAQTIADHFIEGWGWACILITNNDGANPATVEVRGTRY